MTGHDDTVQGGRPHGPRDDVASELAALRRSLRETDGIARESAEVLSETAPLVAELAEQVAALRDAGVGVSVAHEDSATAATRATLGMAPIPPTPWCWPLFDHDEAAAAWEALALWVGEVLAPGYELTRRDLPDCWALHPRMVAELSWLRASYLEAHARGEVAVKAADWHLRHLPGALAALAAAVPVELGVAGARHPLCGPGHHRGPAGVPADEYEEWRQEPTTAEHWRPHWSTAQPRDLQDRRPGPASGPLHVAG